ncbi:hypothetical protein PVK06_042532 [Gossypium arboreum]|uniref:Uncharacterized protein n=1 Tax=Gossypium arboreum TaxID=29729 RepID=A0ABR0MKY8_GOSAR|nr:hypothetical protein PVK06_042532 [Gossypium arboreum]
MSMLMLTQMLTHELTPMVTPMSSSIPISIHTSMLTYMSFTTTYGYSLIVSRTPIASLFYRGGSLSQLPSHGIKDIRWEARTTPHLSTEEGDGDESEDRSGDEDKDEDEGGDEDEYEG